MPAKEDTRQVASYVPLWLYEQISASAKRNHRSMSGEILSILERHFTQVKESQPVKGN